MIISKKALKISLLAFALGILLAFSPALSAQAQTPDQQNQVAGLWYQLEYLKSLLLKLETHVSPHPPLLLHHPDSN